MQSDTALPEQSPPKVVAILADVPAWTFPGLECLGPPPGHYATWLEPLVAEFALEKDFEIHWITMSKRVASAQCHRVFGQSLHILPRRSKMVSMLTGYLREVREIRRVLKAIQPVLVHSWGSEDVYGVGGAFSGVGRRIFTLQGCLTDYLRLLGGNWLFRLQSLYEKPTIRRFLHGTAESPAAKTSLQAIHPDMNVRLVDYGVNPEFFAAEWTPSTEPIVAFVGAVTKRKGILDLIKVAMSPEHAHIKFRIIGEGDLLQSLRERKLPNVEWLGKCNREDVIRNLSSAWCLVMPTYADTGPTVVKEARVVGLPVVTTTGAGASSYIKNAQSGFVTATGDHETLGHSILQVCKSRENCVRMGRHEWGSIRTQLHPRRTAATFAAIYRELISDL